MNDALTRLRTIDSPDRLSFTLTALGALHHAQGDLDTAAPLYEEALEIGRAREDKNTIATALVNLGELSAQRNDMAAARTFYTESLGMYAELGLLNAIAYNLEVLAGLLVSDQADRAAFFMGAADRLINTPIESFNAQRLADDTAAIERALGAEVFAREWQAGAATPFADAVRLAVDSLRGDGSASPDAP